MKILVNVDVGGRRKVTVSTGAKVKFSVMRQTERIQCIFVLCNVQGNMKLS